MTRSVTGKTTSKHGWKKYQHNQKTKNKIFLGIGVLVLLVILVITGKFVGFLGTLASPVSSDETFDSKYSWGGKSNLNLVIKADSLYVFSYHPQDESATVLQISDDIYIEVSRGFGSWPARSIYDLGQAEDPPLGTKLLSESMSNTLGVPIDDYLILSSHSKETLPEIVKGLRQNPTKIIPLLSNVHSSLSKMELIKFWWGVRGIRSDKVEVINLEQTGVTESNLLADGSRGLKFDNLKLDPFIQDIFEDIQLSQEGMTVGIYNSTKTPLLAEKASRIITNLGGRVIFTSNLKTEVGTTIVGGRESYTKERVTQIFIPSCLDKTDLTCVSSNQVIDNSRADVTIILGTDFNSRYSKTGSQNLE